MTIAIRQLGIIALALTWHSDSRAAVHLKWDGAPRQSVVDWGITTAPLDWDGHTMARTPGDVRAIYEQTGPTIGRVLVGATNALEQGKGRIRRPAMDEVLVEQIRPMIEAGVRRYVISVVSAPAPMKRFNASGGWFEEGRNYLRDDAIADLVDFLASLAGIPGEHLLPKPLAISLACCDEWSLANYGVPPALAHATFYRYEQWRSVVEALRRRLDENGLAEVAILGPEMLSAQWIARISVPLRSTSPLGGIALWPDSGKDRLWANSAAVNALAEARAHGWDVWMLGSNCGRAADSTALLFAAFDEMYHDLIDLGVSHWFWCYGIGHQLGSDCLVSLNGERHKELGAALAFLWKNCEANSQVTALASDETGYEVRAFGLVGRATRVIVASNPSAKSAAIVPPDDGWVVAEVGRFAAGLTDSVERRNAQKKSNEITVPPNSVCIVILHQYN